ncbi:uncharacterized protein LOC124490882 [Dermatophagoides farinae]|uniref:uncharacterized protein LOC124490882 n=1 Tax=Dermatophagoides farinae TaxID=6954 RepID=UPI003F5FB4D2
MTTMTSSTTSKHHNNNNNNNNHHHHHHNHHRNHHHHHNQQQQQNDNQKSNGWHNNNDLNNHNHSSSSPISMLRLQTKRGLSLDMDTMMDKTFDDYIDSIDGSDDYISTNTIGTGSNIKTKIMMMMANDVDMNNINSNSNNNNNNKNENNDSKLIDDYTVQYYRTSSAISSDHHSPIMTKTKTTNQNQNNQNKLNKHNRCISNPHNHQFIKANSIGSGVSDSVAVISSSNSNSNENSQALLPITLNVLNNFRFSNEKITDHFRHHHHHHHHHRHHDNDDENNGNGNGDSMNLDSVATGDGGDGSGNNTMMMMDNNRSTRATTPADEQIFQEPVESLQIRIGRLLSCEEMADMHFLVGPNPLQTSSTTTTTTTTTTATNNTQSPTSPLRKLRIPAHRLIMATASPIFRQILLDQSNGQLIECENDLEINDIEPSSFLEFLRYAYTDSAKLNKDNVVGILIAARRYQISTLERQCIDYIHKCLSKRSSLAIWISTRIYGITDLEQVARKSMQHYAESMLLSNDFLRLDQQSLIDILSDDLLRADEIVIFRALTRWAKQNCLRQGLCPNRANVRMIIGNALNLIRFPLMSEEQLQRIVAAEGILEDELLRALVHCSRNWPRTSNMMMTESPLTTFSNEPRAFQKLAGRLHNVYRFASFENSLPNRYLNRSLNFLANKRVWLAGVGLYAPRKACTFYLNVCIRVRRADHDNQQWHSPLDRLEHTMLLKYDGSGHIINMNFDEPLQIEANVQYEVLATITPSPRSTSLVRARLHPHLYYTRPNEVNFYYGTDGQYATKVRINNRGENVIFNFNWERDAIHDDNNSDNTSNNQFFNQQSTNQAVSEPTTPHPPPPPPPPPRPPPPQEYQRPTRMQRLRRALSFVDNREKDMATITARANHHARECGLLEGQIPLLMFYA